MTKIEEAAEKYAIDTPESMREIRKISYIQGIISDAAKEYHTKEARELIEEMKKQLIFLTNSYRLLSEDEFDNNNLITKAETFLNK